MTKKSGLTSKKRMYIIVTIGLIILAAGAGAAYYFYTQNQKQQTEKAAEQKKAVATERSKLDDTAFRGDRDAAAEYIALAQAEQFDAAFDVYESAARNLTDDAAKIALYEQAVEIAHQAKQPEQAIKYAIKLSDLADTHRASANVAYLYGINKDYENQKKYLQQAIDQLESLPKDSQEYTGMKTYYQDMLTKVGAS